MADARASGNTRKSRVGDQRDVLAEWQMLQCGRELIGFLHACPQRAATREHHHIARLDATFLDGVNGRALAYEYARWTFDAVDAGCVHQRRVDGSAFNNATFGRQVAAWK